MYPVTLLRQNSTVYESSEIGIYDKRWEEELTDNSIKFQSRKLLAKDSAYLCFILFTICLVESKNIQYDPLNYSIFNIIFELVRQVPILPTKTHCLEYWSKRLISIYGSAALSSRTKNLILTPIL